MKLMDENKFENLFEHGFCKLKLTNKNFDHLKKNIDIFEAKESDQINGYSTNIYSKLDSESKKITKNLAEEVKKLKEVNSYLKFSSVMSILVLKAKYSELANRNPTAAMLWHRDLDDYLRQLKIIIPLNDHSLENGCFSVASKKIADRTTMFIDSTLKERKDNQNNDSIFRVSDKIFRKNFSEYIYDFEAKEGDCLIVDTNLCYHRGGQILNQNLKRDVIQIHLGYITNIHHHFMKKKELIIPFVISKSIRSFLKILRLPIGSINSNKRVIN